MKSANTNNEMAAERAFTKQSAIFDEIYSGNLIVQYKRERVRSAVLQYLQEPAYILELNAGTGEDAIWFAKKGHRVHATDISAGMQNRLIEKVKQHQLESRISQEICSFTKLEELRDKGPYDMIFSNFAGLNCTGDLYKVLDSFESLLKPGGIVTLVILPKFCFWETLLVFRGKFKTAFRRFFSKKGVAAHVEGEYFTCWYYNPSYIIKRLKNKFRVLSIEGLCSLVPPSYLENFPIKRPNFFAWLKRKEEVYKSKWPWKSIGDYYIIILKKLH